MYLFHIWLTVVISALIVIPLYASSKTQFNQQPWLLCFHRLHSRILTFLIYFKMSEKLSLQVQILFSTSRWAGNTQVFNFTISMQLTEYTPHNLGSDFMPSQIWRFQCNQEKMQEFRDISQPQNQDLYFNYHRVWWGTNGFPCTAIISSQDRWTQKKQDSYLIACTPSKESGESHDVNQQKTNQLFHMQKMLIFSRISILYWVWFTFLNKLTMEG
jgi:hypothetical protein